MNTSFTYKDSGVDIEAGDNLVEKIKPFAKKTIRPEVLAGIGGFGAMFEIGSKYKNPVLVSGTDGVGTKLKLAFQLNKHDTIGIDLVAMSVNDILVQGAEPLFFLDYFACGKLDVDTAASVIQGIAKGCEESGCSLVGGETAEMPGMYVAGEYDLAGFAVGVVERNKIIDGNNIMPGDVILGLESSGFHSNGYSLVRKVISQTNLDLNSEYAPNQSWGEAILAPTKLYVKPILELLQQVQINGMSHITGGGITGNLPRVFPSHLAPQISLAALPKVKLFTWLQQMANLTSQQMLETFNCGIGYTVIIPKSAVATAEALFTKFKIKTYKIGEVIYKNKLDIEYI
ncbi:MAG: phosphoribosylformylglycinamidine cyclo-ligase [Burkholderiales bacterium]|jgi:phosphoribosylformylglycinamidine cyclo-ligase|nr:phosphoribosylformylglycinamidine cyclo-ligase [Burkholderiales bacterium]